MPLPSLVSSSEYRELSAADDLAFGLALLLGIRRLLALLWFRRRPILMRRHCVLSL